jgi:hypothetical protein
MKRPKAQDRRFEWAGGLQARRSLLGFVFHVQLIFGDALLQHLRSLL